jgi:glycosyltransferase involved in cell wall biosynthesis
MYWLAHGLVNNGLEVTIISTDAMLDQNIKRDVWLDTDYGKVIFHHDHSHAFPLKAIRSVWKVMKNIDIVHLNSIFYPFSFICGLFALWYDRPIIWSVRGELDKEALIYSKWKKGIYLYFFKLLFSSRATFHTTATEELNYTKVALGKNSNVVKLPNYMILPQKVDCIKENYISYMGRIHPIKAIENLIDAVKLSTSFQHSDFKLKIAGNTHNPYGKTLIEKVNTLGIADKVEFVGHIEGKEKERFLAASYFNIMPSHTENFGLVVIEALAQGTPVIASLGSPWKELVAKKAGFWVGNDIKSLTKTINEILNLEVKQYEEYSVNAIKLSKEYNIEIGIHEWSKIYYTSKSQSTTLSSVI